MMPKITLPELCFAVFKGFQDPKITREIRKFCKPMVLGVSAIQSWGLWEGVIIIALAGILLQNVVMKFFPDFFASFAAQSRGTLG